jgi:hypothetical protein
VEREFTSSTGFCAIRASVFLCVDMGGGGELALAALAHMGPGLSLSELIAVLCYK